MNNIKWNETKTKSQLLLQVIEHKEAIISRIQKSSQECDVSDLMSEVVGMAVVHKAHQKGGNLKKYIAKYCRETPAETQNKSFVVGVYFAEKILA